MTASAEPKLFNRAFGDFEMIEDQHRSDASEMPKTPLNEVTMVRIDRRGNIVRRETEAYPSPSRHSETLHSQSRHSELLHSESRHSESLIAPTETASPPPVANLKADEVMTTDSASIKRRRSDSMTQSLVLLATMTIMLLSARFIVPFIVEEVRYAWYRGQLRAEYETAGDGLKNVSLSALSQAYQMVTSAVGPSVVHLDVSRDAEMETQGFSMLGGGRPGRGPGSGSAQMMSDQGSGVVVDIDGYILTNEHVVKDGGRIIATLSDGRQRQATVVGIDRLTDLAVLKIDADGLMPIAWGDSDDCRVGSPVWAVGSPFGLDRTVTFGILSGKHRMLKASSNTAYQDFMQSDVAVNPGNSGGPLVDADGKLVGINTAILGDFYQGVSFSIPSNVARRIYQSIRDDGVVERAYLGVMLAAVPDEMMVGENTRRRGALVGGLAQDSSPAGRAGVKPGDIILKFDGVAVDDTAHLMRMVGNETAGNVIAVELVRRGKPVTVEVLLGSKPR